MTFSQEWRSTSVGHVAVIGAGVVGLSCALWLQLSGHKVTIIDPNMPEDASQAARGSSFGNACTIALGACLPIASPGILWKVPGMLIDRTGPLSIYWRDLPQLVPWLRSFILASRREEYSRITGHLGLLMRHAEAGHKPLQAEASCQDILRRNGCLYLYRTQKSFEGAQRDIFLRKREGVRMSILSAAEIRERQPKLAPLYHTGLMFEDAYHIDTPYEYVSRLYAAATRRGARSLRQRATELKSAEKGVAVRTDEAVEIFNNVVVAAGAWSSRLAEQIGDRPRLNTERGYHVLFDSIEPLLSMPTCYPEYGFYMTPLSEGLRSAGTVELGGLDKPMREERTRMIEVMTRKILPTVGMPSRRWLGFRPSTPDSLPIIGPSPTDGRVLYAFGHGHVGLTLAGITGKLVAQALDNRSTEIPLEPFRVNRW